jgi:putative membrane protein
VCAALAAAAVGYGLRGARADDRQTTDDRQFVMQASAAGLAEVNLGNMGVKQAHSRDVKKFAEHMVKDHTKANQRLDKLADRLRIMPAQAMDAKHQAAADRMAQMNGAGFDHAFMRQMVKDHEQAVSLFEAEAKHGQDKELRDFAKKTLPTLKEHLKMARDLAGEGSHDRDRDHSRDKSDRDHSGDKDKSDR